MKHWFTKVVAVASLATCTLPAMARKVKDQGEIIYLSSYNGKMTGDTIRVFFADQKAQIFSKRSSKNELQLIDYAQAQGLSVLTTQAGEHYTLQRPFENMPSMTATGETEKIAGVLCEKYEFVSFSNKMEMWIAKDSKIHGSPYNSMGADKGLVLKVRRNGNSTIEAAKINYKKLKPEALNWPSDFGKFVDAPHYTQQQIENRYETIPVFDHQHLNFGDELKAVTNPQENVAYRVSKGAVVLKKIRLPKRDDARVFARLTQYSEGDAYDRTGSVFVIPTDKPKSFLDAFFQGLDQVPSFKDNKGRTYQGMTVTDDYTPPMELMRFFTSFGVRAYNDKRPIAGYPWADSTIYKQDISELLPAMQEEVWIGVFIGNYAKNGHNVSLDLMYYPSEEPKTKKWVSPIFDTVNLMEMAGQEYPKMFDGDTLEVEVNIPEGVKNVRLRYVPTGHGGWGTGDEFVPKENRIFVDGKLSYRFTPWRTDCATYRLSNPASGNFGNGMSSSDLSRSNWCPGTLTQPTFISMPELTPGKHLIRVAIPQGADAGTMFNFWCVSGTLIGDYE
ncbi:PNGase F N-terminal domain-containing protein [Persicobacter psychrovividus]|uniref:Peptide-N-glycosidase F N-terminal domain-containing protein n=1 Tax=Persicobacter psychrovividus TaxID=387638 RepID=A0ABM7VAU5_9BACT|nr:hypothetical protein PEPS_00780 [Persicobacter psychrovividus]